MVTDGKDLRKLVYRASWKLIQAEMDICKALVMYERQCLRKAHTLELSPRGFGVQWC